MPEHLSEDDLVEFFRPRGLFRGNELYLDPTTSVDFADACEKNDLAIIGIEGFIYTPPWLEPQMDLIADWSLGKREAEAWEVFRQRCNRISGDFIRRLRPEPGLLLNFTVVSSRERWR